MKNHAPPTVRCLLTTPTDGRPNADRSWTECFAQLVGTVLSLWDAGALDAAGEDGEVAPTFINLADASIKMVIFLLLQIIAALLTHSQMTDRNVTHSFPRFASIAECA